MLYKQVHGSKIHSDEWLHKKNRVDGSHLVIFLNYLKLFLPKQVLNIADFFV